MICLEGCGWGESMVAARPVEVRSGRLGIDRLPEPANAGERWVGWIDYDGSWLFARFAGCYLHSGGQGWRVLGAAHDPPQILPGVDPQPRTAVDGGVDISAGMERGEFESRVSRAREYIAAGDIYQVNLSHQCRVRGAANPEVVYERLRRLSPAPHLAFLSIGGRAVASASPETFLDIGPERVVTKPIKGTRGRGQDEPEDLRMLEELRGCTKERAELVMITDLLRNDLGRFAVTGSVRVEALCEVESFAQVHHLVSTVSCARPPACGLNEILGCCFPGGSINGAPKKRAMEIIAELEQVPRGLYTGAIGWIGAERAVFSIAIRTLVFERGLAAFHVGAGIVADSIPEREYEETVVKGLGLRRALLE